MSGRLIPTGNEVVREAITVMAGAVLAAVVIAYLPGLRAWMRQQWDGSKPA